MGFGKCEDTFQMIIKHVKLFLMEVVYKRKLYISNCYKDIIPKLRYILQLREYLHLVYNLNILNIILNIFKKSKKI